MQTVFMFLLTTGWGGGYGFSDPTRVISLFSPMPMVASAVIMILMILEFILVVVANHAGLGQLSLSLCLLLHCTLASTFLCDLVLILIQTFSRLRIRIWWW